jgi:hypothetical protein
VCSGRAFVWPRWSAVTAGTARRCPSVSPRVVEAGVAPVAGAGSGTGVPVPLLPLCVVERAHAPRNIRSLCRLTRRDRTGAEHPFCGRTARCAATREPEGSRGRRCAVGPGSPPRRSRRASTRGRPRVSRSSHPVMSCTRPRNKTANSEESWAASTKTLSTSSASNHTNAGARRDEKVRPPAVRREAEPISSSRSPWLSR